VSQWDAGFPSQIGRAVDAERAARLALRACPFRAQALPMPLLTFPSLSSSRNKSSRRLSADLACASLLAHPMTRSGRPWTAPLRALRRTRASAQFASRITPPGCSLLASMLLTLRTRELLDAVVARSPTKTFALPSTATSYRVLCVKSWRALRNTFGLPNSRPSALPYGHANFWMR